MPHSIPLEIRTIPDYYDQRRLTEIDRQLEHIAHGHSVSIGLAVESGSRAWGFPSPDSDFDCRFIFIRHPNDYLSPWQMRDVIETPLIGELDVNGWELGKALKLLLKGNAVIIEWMMSPIIYAGDSIFREGLARLIRFADRNAVARHYLHLGMRQRRNYFSDEKEVPLKKLFYALRPAVALRWLRLHPEATIAPMHLPTLLRESDVPADVQSISSELIEQKAQTRELGEGLLPKAIISFIDEEFAEAHSRFERLPFRILPDAKVEAAQFFRQMATHFAATTWSRQWQATQALLPE